MQIRSCEAAEVNRHEWAEPESSQSAETLQTLILLGTGVIPLNSQSSGACNDTYPAI